MEKTLNRTFLSQSDERDIHPQKGQNTRTILNLVFYLHKPTVAFLL